MSVIIKGMAKPNSCHECPLLYVTSICDGSRPCPIIPVQHGHWVLKKHKVRGSDVLDFNCSACKRYWFHNGEMRKVYKYCPNCGAKMDGGEDNGEIH